jgi:multiple sugar transport system substrate-binding protein
MCNPVVKGTFVLLLLILPAMFTGCNQKDHDRHEGTLVVFKHGKFAGDPRPLREILDRFEAVNPGIRVRDETLPSSSDEQHQFYVINLEGKGADFDVLSLDVVWVPEFARAGWLRDLSLNLGPGDREEFFPGPMAAVTWQGKVYAIPWYIDAGLLYYRSDLLRKYGFSPPRTWPEMVAQARYITSREKGLYGFIWQGKQYEGVVCNALEFMRSNGGEVLGNGEVVVDSPENIAALGFMRDLIEKYGVSPPLVTTAVEETTRHIFGNGRALFMRNWPYAWDVFQATGSTVRGKVGVAPLPAFPGGVSAPTLGGWQLGVNRHSRHPEAAARLVAFLTSPEAQKRLCLDIGYKPSRISLYTDRELLERQPFIASLRELFMTARPRPVTPYYMMITQVMQPELSAALAGVRSPEAALGSAARQMRHILGSVP